MIPHFYESIPGWFNFQDIYHEAVDAASDGAVFVEVGSWLGRSTAFLAVEIANSGKAITLHAVDTWTGSPGEQYQRVMREHGASVFDVFDANMRAGGVRHLVHPIGYASTVATDFFHDHSVDFVFLDAAHDFHSVRADVRAWLPKVKIGGILGGHDANCPGLMNAVKEHVPASAITYRGTSWLHAEDGDHRMWYPPWVLRSIAQRVGIWDDGLEYALGVADYNRRVTLACGGPTETAAHLLLHRDVPVETDIAPYLRKWGGPPGAETFDFPYGVTTLDW